MASKTALNADNLETLGLKRLARLLIDVSTGDAAIKRRLRLELAGAESPSKLVHEIRKRLSAIESGKTFIGWRTIKTFRTELRNIEGLIADPLGIAAPVDALELMWRFLDMGNAVLERTSDTGGEILDIFKAAATDIGAIAAAAQPDVIELAAAAGSAILANGYGQADGLILALTPVLGPSGLDQLRGFLIGVSKEKAPRPAGKVRQVSKWRRGRTLDRDVTPRRSRSDIIHHAFLDIADALGDVDAYIALHGGAKDAGSAVQFATRLTNADRIPEALAMLDEVRSEASQPLPVDWYRQRAAALDGLGRPDEGQETRLDGFHHTLGAPLLRDYLKRLPDFEDVEAEDAALAFAKVFPAADTALDFLLRWPNLEKAALLIIGRQADIDTRDESLLIFGADKLSGKYPVAAVLLLRKLINAILKSARVDDFDRAAEYLADCGRLDARIDDYRGIDDHAAYVAHLKTNFRHRHDFWEVVS